MKYTGQFKNIDNTLYQVDIYTNGAGTTELTFGSDPFVITYNDGDTIYKPIKMSNATCSVLSTDYMFDIYTSTIQGVKMVLTNVDSNKIDWVGYVTPNLYTQDWEIELEKINIEAVDAISTLEQFKYKSIDVVNKKIKSFEDIIISIIKKCNCYNHIYINQNSSLNETADKTNIINKLFISEQNFFSQDVKTTTYNQYIDKIVTTNDYSSDMNCREVLTEIMQYLNYTLVAFGDAVYIIDYNGIKDNNVNYTHYSTSNNWLTKTIENTTLSDVSAITGSSFKKNGSSIELDKTYNSISVKTNLYNNDTLLPAFFNDDKLTNTLTNWIDYVTHNSDNTVTNWASTNYLDTSNTYYLHKYFNHSDFNYYIYDNDTNWNIVNTPLSYDVTLNNIGAGIVKYAAVHSSIEKPSFSNYIQLFRHLPNNPTDAQNICKKVLSLKPNVLPEVAYMLSNEYYILVNCSAAWSDENVPFITDHTRKNDTEWGRGFLFLTAKLKIGNKYWNGTTWTLTDSTFRIYFDKGNEAHLINKWFSVQDNIYLGNQYDYANVSERGQLIPITKSFNLMGAIEFELYTPQAVDETYRTEHVFIKDFSIKYVKGGTKKNTDTDTNYQNEISGDYVNEFSELNLKVCSHTNKGMSYSSVLQKNDDNTFAYNTAIVNKSINLTQPQEYNIINKYVQQYSVPQRVLNLTLENKYKPYSLLTCSLFAGDKYIIDKMSIDIYNNTNTVTLINKS